MHAESVFRIAAVDCSNKSEKLEWWHISINDCVFSNIWRLEWVRDTSFDINVSNEKLQSNIYNRAIFIKIINGLTIFANNFIVDVRLGSK